MTGNGRTAVSGTVLVATIAVMFIAVVAAAVAIAIGLPDDQNPAGLIAQLLGGFATLVVALGTLFKVSQVEQRTSALADGLMDAKVRSGVAEVLDDALIDPEVEDQLVEDRATIAARHEGTHATVQEDPRGR